MVAQGDWTKFEKRLAWEGTNLQSVRSVLGSVKADSNKHQLPTWTYILNECLEATKEVDLDTLAEEYTDKNRFLSPQTPLPFEEVLLAFVHVARQKLIERSGSNYNLLAKTAHTNLERSLLGWLSYLCSLPMELEFSALRASKKSAFARILEQSNDDVTNRHYQNFIRSLVEGKLKSFFEEYCVLARLMATAIELWVDSNEEFLRRLNSDWSEIQSTFQTKSKLGLVVAIQPCLSDRHHGGRSVTALTFESGLKLVYKPKNIDLEQIFFDLLGWLNQHEFSLSFKLPKVINRSEYGWVEFVETSKCKEKQEARRYYLRSGALLCLIYLLDATDLHLENIISHGEHPVLIDMETLMHPWVKESDDLENIKNAKYWANQKLSHSVIRSGFLPRWEITSAKQSYDATGLGGLSKQKPVLQVKQWNHINTDKMSISWGDEEIQPSNTSPSQDDVDISLKNFNQEITDGFRQMYHFLIENRELLLAADSPLQKFNHRQVRFVFRATKIYSSTLQQTLHPKFLRDGAERSIQLDILSRVMLLSDSKPSFWTLLHSEKLALEQMDVPLFTARSDSRNLTTASGQTVDRYFTEPSFDLVISRLKKLNDVDLKQQTDFIQGSLHSHISVDGHFTLLSEKADFKLEISDPLTQQEAVREAIAIAEELQKQAIYSDKNSATWIAPQYIAEAQKLQLQPLGYDIYSGSCGIALFLAALEKITGGTRFYNLILAALQPLRSNLSDSSSKKMVEQLGIGAATGCGSIIYGLVQCSQFLSEPTLLEEAYKVAHLITPEIIESDRELDIISGTAGTILSLLSLYNVSNSSEVLEKASICGWHLLYNRKISSSGKKTWATLDRKMMTGFSHGAAGIAYALLRLYRCTGESAFFEAATEAIAYENSLFVPKLKNWLSSEVFPVKENENIECWCSWCHGASGIGLARVGSLDVLDTVEVQQNIKDAVNTTQQHENIQMDHLCCGTLGRVEFLFTAGRSLSQPHLSEIALKQAARVVAYARQRGGFSYGSTMNFQLSFFQGAAGIGYELLRLTHPDRLPSILIWE